MGVLGAGGRRIYCPQFLVMDAVKKWLKQVSKNSVDYLVWGLCASLNRSTP